MDTFFGKIQKKVILICSIVVVIVLFIAYLHYKGNKVEVPSNIAISSDIITKINVEILIPYASADAHPDDYEISAKEDIETIIDFLNGVKTKTKRHKDDSSGGISGYCLEFYDQDNQIVSIVSAGNTVWSIDGTAEEVSYEEFVSFKSIMAEIIYKQYHNNVSYDCRKGKVKKVYNEDTQITDDRGFELLSRKRTCIIDTDDKKIDISYAYRFDFKRNEYFGSPKKGDQVEIYLKAGEENVKAVFILND